MKRFQFINPRNLLFCLSMALSLSLASCSGRPDVASRIASQAQEQLQNGEIKLAQLTIKRAIKERDDMPEIFILRGRIELAAKEPAKALDAYSDALALDKANPEALQAAAQLGLQVGRFQVAEDAADRILAISPEDSNALLVLGLLRIVGHRNDQAMEYADRILVKNPSNEPANILKARALFISGKPDEALSHILKVVPVTGPTEGESMTLLELYRERGEAAKMLQQFEFLRKLRPNDFTLRVDEANLRYKLGDLAPARALTGQALLRAGDERSEAASAVALLREYDRSPFNDEQLKTLAEKASLNSLVELARYYLDNGQPAKVATLFGTKQSDDVRALLARTAIAQGNQKTGLALAEEVLSRDKTQCDAKLARAEFNLQTRRMDAAIRDAQEAQSQCPRIAAGWLILARSYIAKGDAPGTRQVFDQAVGILPQDRMISEAFARWLIGQKQGQRAASEGHRLVRAVPALLSGWTMYHDICQTIADSMCLSEANRGLTEAKGNLGIDPPKGERPPAGLFGRMRRI
jgi:tetratricopeptide (TPR) repeat protein